MPKPRKDSFPRVAIVGLGYVGLPLAVEMLRAGREVVGIDIDPAKARMLAEGALGTEDASAAFLSNAAREGRFSATTDFREAKACAAIVLCVPTPVGKSRDPDMGHILRAAESIALHLSKGALVVLESTSYPGTTEELLLPLFEQGGKLRAGKDFHLGFSPERIDPGNKRFPLRAIPKVVSGATPACLRAARALYEPCFDTVHPVSSPRAAEMAKLLENTFRAVNIGLVNEVAQMCDRLGIDVWEVVGAAATKPFGFMPFQPGPGLGGHCIPVDPLYLSWKLRTLNHPARFIDLAAEINGSMPGYVVYRAMRQLSRAGKAMKGARVHLLGVAYKPDVGDVRESPALVLLELLRDEGAVLSYSDPHVPAIDHLGIRLKAKPLSEAALAKCDLALVATHHSAFDADFIARHAPLVFDCRNLTGGLPPAPHVEKL